MKTYDLIVVGGGHAGIEAVFSGANLGKNVLLISLDKTKLAMMPCNPSIGGPAKGIITKEIDALGGMQGYFSDLAMTQIKMLNYSKGPAVKAIRAQIDKIKYSKIILEAIEENKNIEIVEDIAEKIIVLNNCAIGVKTSKNTYQGKKIILTTGTYMNSYVFRGKSKIQQGPDGQKTTTKLSQSLKKLGFKLIRLKTGTPPRVFSKTVDFTKVEKEILAKDNLFFSSRSSIVMSEQISSFITYTNSKLHKIILDNLSSSSMFSGAIEGIGPRYCPSIEDKIVKFPDKKRHQIFYEFETTKKDLVYVNGLSTSLPADVQDMIVKTLPGMSRAKIAKYGYAIEYDSIDSRELDSTLESKKIKNLYFAGQINGTSGYEEAAAQGLMAGINASLAIDKKHPLILRRDQAYIGVLIDDLITKGTNEPYRMLTSRAEYRLLLRNDNADLRLTAIGYQIGLVKEKEFLKVQNKYKEIKNTISKLKETKIKYNSLLGKKYNLSSSITLFELLKRPEVDLKDFAEINYIYEIATYLRLKGYIKKQKNETKKMNKYEKIVIPNDLQYNQILNIATEAKMKLGQIRPRTIGQALRIPGVNLSDIQMLMFYLKFKVLKKNKL